MNEFAGKMDQAVKIPGPDYSTWLDLFPLKDKEKKRFSPILDELRGSLSSEEDSHDLLRHISQMSLVEGRSKTDKRFLRKISKWIALGMTGFNKLDDEVDFQQRIKRDLEVKSKRRQPDHWIDGIENWTLKNNGVYSDQMIDLPKEDLSETKDNLQERKMPIEIVGTAEHFLSNRINQLLETKRDSNKPVVFVDFGGMQGFTAVRLAERYRKEIENGRLVIVVTNLAAGKEEVGEMMKRSLSKYPEIYQWALKNSTQVNYLQANAGELQLAVIRTPKGPVNLNGNVDILHEDTSISMHGLVNERDYSLLGDMLSQDGFLMIKGHDFDEYFFIPLDSSLLTRKTIRKEKRGEVFKIGSKEINYKLNYEMLNPKENRMFFGFRNLLKKGLKLVEAVPDGESGKHNLSYAFFVKPQSPQLHFFDISGKEYVVPTNQHFKK